MGEDQRIDVLGGIKIECCILLDRFPPAAMEESAIEEDSLIPDLEFMTRTRDLPSRSMRY